jgi:hypothetical protein
MSDWWKSYPGYSGRIDLLKSFKTEEEFTDLIPYDLKLSINKIKLTESCVWIQYFYKYNSWPTTKKINEARGSRLECKNWYSVEDLLVNDNYGEHF